MYGIDIKVDKLQSHQNSNEHLIELLQDCSNGLFNISKNADALKSLLEGDKWTIQTESSHVIIKLVK